MWRATCILLILRAKFRNRGGIFYWGRRKYGGGEAPAQGRYGVRWRIIPVSVATHRCSRSGPAITSEVATAR